MSNYFEEKGIIQKDLVKTQKITRSPIISCSRRTDIPAFLMDWVLDKIKLGFVDVQNPFNRKIITRVSLDPKDVLCWVWWSKDFHQWIELYKKNPKVLDKYPLHIFNFTINSRSELESGLNRSLEERMDQAQWIIQQFGVKNFQWRFDPIVFYRKKGDLRDNPKKEAEVYNNIQDFEVIASRLSSFGVQDVIFSFATWYPKVEKRMESRGKIIKKLSLMEKQEVLDSIIQIAGEYDIFLHACCQPDLVGYQNITQAHCVDGSKIQDFFKDEKKHIDIIPDKGQRENCGCAKSQDIGGYSGIFKCKHNCDYCYANPSKK